MSNLYYSKNQKLKIIFFDVGQGDAILISQGNNQLLVDSGRSGRIILEKLGEHIPFWDRKIEMVLMTHPDQDHIGGFIDVFKNYDVKTVIQTKIKNDSQVFGTLNEYIAKEECEIIEGISGVKIFFSNNAEMEIIYPFDSITKSLNDTNSASIVSILKSGKTKFLLTGDLPSEKEAEILQRNIDISADVVKIAHHGSKYSTNKDFLAKISPREAVISVGKNNSYGHPAPEILEILKKEGINVLRTDMLGDIIWVCDNFEIECQLIKY